MRNQLLPPPPLLPATRNFLVGSGGRIWPRFAARGGASRDGRGSAGPGLRGALGVDSRTPPYRAPLLPALPALPALPPSLPPPSTSQFLSLPLPSNPITFPFTPPPLPHQGRQRAPSVLATRLGSPAARTPAARAPPRPRACVHSALRGTAWRAGGGAGLPCCTWLDTLPRDAKPAMHRNPAGCLPLTPWALQGSKFRGSDKPA